MAPSWGRQYNGKPRSSATISTERWTAEDARDLLEPFYVSLVPHWDGQPVCYAPVVKTSKAGADLVQLDCEDILTLADDRFTHFVQDYGQAPFTITNRSPTGALLRVIRHAVSGYADPRRNLPLSGGGTETSGSVSRSIPQHELQTIGSIIRELQDSEGAPSVELQPILEADGSIGLRPTFGPQPIASVVAEYIVPAGREVVSWSWQIDAVKQITGVVVAGEGSGQDMLTGRLAHVSPSYRGPYRHTTIPMKLVSNQAQLNQHARAYRDAHDKPTTQFSLTVRIGQITPTVRLGSVIRVYPIGEKLLEQRWYQCVVIGVSGDGTKNVHLELQEAR
ncbi:hypothetical protein [Pseudoclavibacter endophyticus]|uniref:Phage tail protein n=1 Tax=Pseudoclavibacter endophyticus TaxID=1778590 RepID=A0A6H9WQT2_9MICO|nr:hypothetical protein [Pseudoclavibacter endophyticus]KAB1648431.1 hypothetical protein F8O04_12155 [Pseudoclavibacter endophyticus]